MLVVDVESSGVDYEKNSIISVGAIDLSNPTNQLYEECRIWEGAHISEEATAIHGVSDAELTDPKRQSEADLVHKFITWAMQLPERTLAGQNVSFDRDFLRAAAHRAGHTEWPFAHRTIDTHTLCYMHMVKAGLTPPVDPEHHRSALNLDAVLNYCGIPDEPKPHNALTGAMSHAEVISRLLYDKKLLPIFEQYDIPWKR
jgi:DNA polymerase III epsilon subunit-like protein